jgi:hypothetical protein
MIVVAHLVPPSSFCDLTHCRIITVHGSIYPYSFQGIMNFSQRVHISHIPMHLRLNLSLLFSSKCELFRFTYMASRLPSTTSGLLRQKVGGVFKNLLKTRAPRPSVDLLRAYY